MNEDIIRAWDGVTPSQADRDRMLSNIIRQSAQAKPRFRPRRALALALALTALLGATAFALSEAGVINWFGKLITDRMPELPESEKDILMIQERAQQARALLDQTPEDELWVAEIWEKTNIVRGPYKNFGSARALAAHLASAGLPFPALIPPGYAYTSGGITPYLSPNTAQNGLLPLPGERTRHGFTIKKYRVTTDYAADIDSWHASFRDDKGNVLTLAGFRDSNGTQYAYNTSASGPKEALGVKGMDEAIYIAAMEGRAGHSLNFRQTGLARLVRNSWIPPGDIPGAGVEPAYYDSLVYRFDASALGRDELLAIAESLR